MSQWPDLKACASETLAEARRCADLSAHYAREAKRLREQARQFEEVAKDPLWKACHHATNLPTQPPETLKTGDGHE